MNALLLHSNRRTPVITLYQALQQRLLPDLLEVDTLVHRVPGHEAVDVDFIDLPLPVNSVDGLGLVRWVPMFIDYDGVRGRHQIETGAPSLGRDQKDSQSRFAL
jgi:hypothetical protein